MAQIPLISHYIVACTQKFADFESRATRQEFWSFTLINCIILFTTLFLTVTFAKQYTWLVFCYLVFLFMPTMAISVRRMHDLGKTGWWVVVPVVNLIFSLMPGDYGQNKYGADPLNPEIGFEIDQIGKE